MGQQITPACPGKPSCAASRYLSAPAEHMATVQTARASPEGVWVVWVP